MENNLSAAVTMLPEPGDNQRKLQDRKTIPVLVLGKTPPQAYWSHWIALNHMTPRIILRIFDGLRLCDCDPDPG